MEGVGAYNIICKSMTRRLFWVLCHLCTVSEGLVGGDDHVGGDEEGPVLSGRHHIVSLVPDPLVQQPQTGLQLGGHVLVQPGDGVALHLEHATLQLVLLYNVCSYIEVMCSPLYFFEIF